MSADRKRMIEVLKSEVVPILRAKGFKGSFPHFRRLANTGIHLLTFQFDKWGGGFVVEVAACPKDGFTMHWGEHISPNKVTAHHVNERLRLGAKAPNSDHWFRYDQPASGDSCIQASSELLPYIEHQAEQYWHEKSA